ncbi:hypothetical protein AABM17_354 [Neisseria musculi]|uniref:Uncharacterized protein n=1 Tax=Neisseria musculi TaxID=1815583 RepID=A0A7H1MAA4_9NEIS|nr:hypothetical protein H7A79_0355 [Neisseria musculi]
MPKGRLNSSDSLVNTAAAILRENASAFRQTRAVVDDCFVKQNICLKPGMVQVPQPACPYRHRVTLQAIHSAANSQRLIVSKQIGHIPPG